MRNLRCLQHSSIDEVPGIKATAWDVSNDAIICLRESNNLLRLKRWNNGRLNQIACWDAPLNPYEILDLHFFADTESACIIYDNGDIVVVRENPVDEERIEIVGSIDVGISAAAWSPDEELLVVATKASTLIYLTRDYEDLVSLAFTAQDLEASDHVSVGWGKKETQFKGKKNRTLRDPTVPETVDDGRLAEGNEFHETAISWRGDGVYIAINAIEQSNQRRVIRIYSRDGILDSVSEPVNGLIGPLSWRPAGNLLAAVQLFEGNRQVVLFERNGLRHGQFSLRPLDDVDRARNVFVRSLQWNIDSTVLAVSYDDRIQLWTMGNNHWYLKQELFDIRLTWHPEKALAFSLISTSCNSIRRFQYSLDVSAGPIMPPCDHGVVAVLDGKNLKITPFRHANIPPPMSLYEVQMKGNGNDVLVTLRSTEHEMSQQPVFKISVLHPSNRSSRYTLDLGAGELQLQAAEEQVADSGETAMNGNSDTQKGYALPKPVSAVCPIDFQLTGNGSLLANEKILARGCTSFLVTPSHLIFTTSQHFLKFVHSVTNPEDLEIPPDTPESDERCRSIERGAKLVTAMPSIFAVVLQMPRGNLETVYPRALVLAAIRNSIDGKKYKKAFFACRNQRVDMNILHDHRPDQFIVSVGTFVDQLKKVEHIDLFLSSLRSVISLPPSTFSTLTTM